VKQVLMRFLRTARPHLLDAERTRRLRESTVLKARRARREVAIVLPLTIGVLLVFRYRQELFGADVPVRIACVVALLLLGLRLARDIGRALEPALFRRLDPGTAGTVGFLIRLTFVAVSVVVALRLAGLSPDTLAFGGAVTAVVLGLAAQQTLGNVFAGTVLLSARPFRVGDRIRLHAGGLAGQVTGTVETLGLLYTTLRDGVDRMMVPNSVVLSAAIVPLHEPPAIDLRARLTPGITPREVQRLLEEEIQTPTLERPHVALEEIDGNEVVVRISATPRSPDDGPRLAEEVLAAVAPITKAAAQSRAHDNGGARHVDEVRHDGDGQDGVADGGGFD
jgi:small conductance mechanosensitive channel